MLFSYSLSLATLGFSWPPFKTILYSFPWWLVMLSIFTYTSSTICISSLEKCQFKSFVHFFLIELGFFVVVVIVVELFSWFFKLMFSLLNCRNSLHILDSNLIRYKMGKAQKASKESFTSFYITEHSNFKFFPRVAKKMLLWELFYLGCISQAQPGWYRETEPVGDMYWETYRQELT